MMGDVGRYGNYFVALIFFVVGLHLLGVIPLPLSGPGQVNMKRKGMLAAFILGLVFGVALGPCTFAYMAPMLGVTFKLAATNFLYGVALLLAYGVGTLRGDCAGRHVHGSRATVPELERAIQGRDGGEIRLRRAGDAGRGMADLCGQVKQWRRWSRLPAAKQSGRRDAEYMAETRVSPIGVC